MTIDHEALVEVVQALVQVPSVYDPATGRSEEGAARLVAHQLRSFGWTPEIDPVAPGRPNVYAVVGGGRVVRVGLHRVLYSSSEWGWW